MEGFEPDDLVECAIYRQALEAIENLIAKIKELEDTNMKFALNGGSFAAKHYIEDNYIPKSKVKEKIEEIKGLEDIPKEIDFKAYYRVKDLRNIQIIEQLTDKYDKEHDFLIKLIDLNLKLLELLQNNTGNHIPRID